MTGLPGPVGRIRVLRVIARLNVGGPALHATLLAERLDPLRYDSLLATGREEQAEGNYLALHGRTIGRLALVPALGREIRGPQECVALAQLVGVMRAFRPHIVHTHTAKAGTLGRLAAKLCRAPVVVHTYHGHVLQGYFSPAKTRLFVTIERVLGRRTDRLLTVSERVRQELLGLGIGTPDRFDVVPLGLDLGRFLDIEAHRGSLGREIGLPGGDLLVGIVARLAPIKAHEVFLEAAALIAAQQPRTRFIVVGDGQRRAELEAMAARLGLSPRVHFVGWRRDLERVYADLDLVVLTSRNEGSPVSLIEAMAASRAVVATRVGGVPDLVEDGVSGLLTPPGDPAALANAATSLLQDAERRRQMGEAGRKRVYPAFDAPRLLGDIDDLYTRLLRAKGQC